MTAGQTSCSCAICGTTCTGRFAGCASVWARGPREVAVDVPRVVGADSSSTFPEMAARGEGGDARWRLPLEPLNQPMTPAVKQAVPPPLPEPIAAPVLPSAPVGGNGNRAADALPTAPSEDTAVEEDDADVPSLESPDITARFAVAQLTELNERVEELTRLATETTEAGLEKVHNELRRITSMREIDLTEQASGIFSAVQQGTQALESFAEVVRSVTEDLRMILHDSLAAIGGASGLAASVAAAQADVVSVREDFGAALARIERDLSVMRQRLPAKAAATTATAKVSDQQVDFIIDAVTEAVTEVVLGAQRGRRGR